MNGDCQQRLQPRISRRRFIKIAAISTSLVSLEPVWALNKMQLQQFTWRGQVLGGDASMELLIEDRTKAAATIKLCLAEIDRLESIFSLHRPGSTIRQLNQHGVLHDPPEEFSELVTRALTLSAQTKGAFDVTIQPLWKYLYYTPQAETDSARLRKLRDLVNYRRIDLAPGRIAFERRGMEITLNGIAQGFITDRVSELLRQQGLANVLVQLGETFALGKNSLGQPWRIGVPKADGPTIVGVVDLTNQALATSSVRGTLVSDNDSFCHLINPLDDSLIRQSLPSNYSSLSVLAKTATDADGLSTALSLIPRQDHRALLSNYQDAKLVFPQA